MARLLLDVLITIRSGIDGELAERPMAQESAAPVRSHGFLERELEHPLRSFHREMSRVFDAFHDRLGSEREGGAQPHGPMMPRIDVSETGQEMRISADLPGVNADDIGVSIVDDILTIRGEKKLEQQGDYHVAERSYGMFLRSLRLPYSVDIDRIRADFANGVLTVTLPKCKEKERSRKIPVQCGRGPDAPLPAGPAQQGSNERAPRSDPGK
jgi:HSP20 family protein